MTTHSNHFYNKQLQPFANQLRKCMTIAEASLWKHALRARQMKGYQFRRQRPVLNYIADFMCKELNLVIEVDGLSHYWKEVAENDKKRDAALQEAGFTVLRFRDEDVLKGMVFVIGIIEDTIEELEKKYSSTPNPRQRGRNTKSNS